MITSQIDTAPKRAPCTSRHAFHQRPFPDPLFSSKAIWTNPQRSAPSLAIASSRISSVTFCQPYFLSRASQIPSSRSNVSICFEVSVARAFGTNWLQSSSPRRSCSKRSSRRDNTLNSHTRFQLRQGEGRRLSRAAAPRRWPRSPWRFCPSARSSADPSPSQHARSTAANFFLMRCLCR